MKYKTSLTAILIESPSKIIGVGSKQYFVDDVEYNSSVSILSFLTEARDIDEITDFLVENKLDFSLFQKLLDNKLITFVENLFQKEDTEDFKNALYLNLLLDNPIEVLARFKDTTFVIIGCGSIGNYISYALSVYSPKKLILVDGNSIERSNLNRQILFSEEDINCYKSEVIARELRKKNSNLDIEVVTEYVSEENISTILQGEDFKSTFGIISGDDSIAVKVSSNKFVENHIPFLNVGYLNDISVIGPFVIPEISACPFCNNTLAASIDCQSDLSEIINKRYSSPSSFTNSALASSLAMSDIVQFFSGNLLKVKSINARVGINSDSFEKYILENVRDPNCSVCGGE